MSPPIRVAISGGGVAGASLLHAILPLPNIDAHIFESAPKFREQGVAFGITRNARHALDLIGPSTRACLERAGGVAMKGTSMLIALGEDVGEEVLSVEDTTTIVQRANLLHEFLDGIPPERMHASKKLTAVDHQTNGSLLLRFEDGSTHECDILIGADGVHSTVRKIILGVDPAVQARNSGGWAIMTLNPYEEARKSLGNSLVNVDDAHEIVWIGHGSFILTTLLSHGQTVQFSIFSLAELPPEPTDTANSWARSVTAEWLTEHFKGWPSEFELGVRNLICNQATRPAIYLWEHPHAKTFASGPICIFGDAAHATTPFMGSGGSMCMEDTMIMSTLLARVSSPAEAVKALRVYDQVRRPRTQRVVEASRRTGELITGSDKEIGLDAKKLQAALDGRWDFIADFDNKQHRDEAIRLLDEMLKDGELGVGGT